MSNENLAVCVGGFDTPEQVANYQVGFYCDQSKGNCGGFAGAKNNLEGVRQIFKLGSESHLITQNPTTGKYYTCAEGQGFSQEVYDTVNYCIHDLPAMACPIAGAATATITALSGGATWQMLLAWTATCLGTGREVSQITESLGFCNLFFQAEVTPVGGGPVACTAGLQVQNKAIQEAEATQNATYNLCSQIPPNQPTRKTNCLQCAAKGGIWTAVGCVDYSPQSIVQTVIKIGLSIAGGVALLMILAAAFLFSTSQGDPKRTTQARDLLTSAVIGLLFIIFSVTILQFIGVSILRIPEFGI